MKYSKSLILLMIVSLLMIGCSKSEDEIESKLVNTETKKNDSYDGDDTSEIPTEEQELLRSEFLDYVKTAPGLVNVRQYVLNNIGDADQQLADDMLYELMAHAKFDVYEEIDVFFLEENIAVHNALNTIAIERKDDFQLSGSFLGEDKDVLLELLEGTKYKLLIEDLFNQGYGLVMGEGAFYPEIDYLALLEDYGDYTSPMMDEYLGILADELAYPTLIEEYLAIEPERLLERSIRAEQFLIDYPQMIKQFRQDIGQVLIATIWKLSGPTIFDGMLTDDFKLSKDMSKLYKKVLKEQTTPIVDSTVEELYEWVESKDGGVLGSLENLEAMYTKYNEIFSHSVEMMDSLYPMK